MAGEPVQHETNVNEKLLNANGRDKWAPPKYQRMATYVLIYDYIKQNLADFCPVDGSKGPSHKYGIDFGLTNSALSVQIDDAIRNHYQFFIKQLNLGKDGFDLGADDGVPPTFVKEMETYIAEGNRLISSGMLSTHDAKDGDHMTVKDMEQVLRAKSEDVRSYFENMRKAVDGKEGNIDPKTGARKGGYLYVALKNAEQQRRDMLKDIAETSGSIVFKSLLSAGSIGLTVASGLALLASGGAAVGAVFGTLFAANPVGMAVCGLVGTIVGVKFTASSLKSLITAIGKEGGLVKKFAQFMWGTGDFKSKDGKENGYYAIRRQFNKTMEIRDLMKNFSKEMDKGIPMSEFNTRFNEYFDNFVANAKYNTAAELEAIRSKVRYVYEVTEKGYFGRWAKAAAQSYATEISNYQWTNPTELANIHRKLLTDDKMSIENVRTHLKDLTERKSTFTDGHQEAVYNELMREYSSKVLNTVTRTAFDEPFTSQTRDRIVSASKDELVSERLKAMYGDEIDRVENISRFIDLETETDKEEDRKKIRTDLDVTLKNQISITKSSILDACSSDNFGTEKVEAGSTDYAKIEEIATEIEGYSEFESSKESSIDAKIGAVASAKARKYLKFIFEKKKDSVKLGETFVADSIGNISGYTDVYPTDVNDIYKICEGFGSGVKADNLALRSIVAKFGGTDTTESISAEIDTQFADKPDVREYLKYMLEAKRSSAPKFSATYFAKQIAGLTENDVLGLDSKKIIQIRKTIMNSNMSEKAKEEAVDRLNTQVDRLYNAGVNKYTEEMIHAFENGSDVDAFHEIVDSIKKITYENFESQENRDIYQIKINQQSSPMKEYLQLQYRRQVERILKQQIETLKTSLKKGLEGLNEVSEMLKRINQFRFLDEIQKDRLTNSLTDSISTAVDSAFRDSIREMITKSGKTAEDYNNLIRNSYADGGFRDYFANNQTIGNIAVRDKVARIGSQVGQLVTWLSGSTQKGAIVENSLDASAVGCIYFNGSDRGLGKDKLSNFLNSIHEIKDKDDTKIGITVADPNVGAASISNNMIGIIKKMLEEYAKDGGGTELLRFDEIDGLTFDASKPAYASSVSKIESIVNNDPKKAQDLFAALLAMKRQCLMMYKKHLYSKLRLLCAAEGHDLSKIDPNDLKSVINSHLREFNAVRSTWDDLFSKIDNLCLGLSSMSGIKSAMSDYLEDYKYISLNTILGENATNEKAGDYARGTTLGG